MKRNSSKIKVAKKYAHELNAVIGQILDVARILLLQKLGEEKGQRAGLELVLSGQDHGVITTASSTLNILQVQQMAFDQDLIQSHFEHLIKQMCAAKALKLAQFSEKRDSPLSMADLEQRHTKMDFKAFVEEFQTQVLGIGKAAVPNQGRYGAPSIPQYLSFPSNETAN